MSWDGFLHSRQDFFTFIGEFLAAGPSSSHLGLLFSHFLALFDVVHESYIVLSDSFNDGGESFVALLDGLTLSRWDLFCRANTGSTTHLFGKSTIELSYL